MNSVDFIGNLESGPFLLAFEVENGKLCVINKEGDRIPLCGASKLNRRLEISDALRELIRKSTKG